MTIDIFTSTGTKKGTLDLPKALFEAPIRRPLMHQFLMLQQSNRRNSIAHSKTRSEVVGSTRKLYAQKGTGRARRGSIRSAILKGGNKAFGPKKNSNFIKNMPQSMRREALFSCLSFQAKEGRILGLEQYPETIKTKTFFELLKKMPVDIGRNILVVTAGKHAGIEKSAKNVQGVKTLHADYLNPEDILKSRHIIFMVDAVKRAEEVFGKKTPKVKAEKAEKPAKKTASKKSTTASK